MTRLALTLAKLGDRTLELDPGSGVSNTTRSKASIQQQAQVAHVRRMARFQPARPVEISMPAPDVRMAVLFSAQAS